MSMDDRQADWIRFRQTAVLCWSGLVLFSVLVLSRRAVSGISSPATLLPFLFATSCVTGLSLLAWVSFQLGTRCDSRRQHTDWIAGILTVMPTVMTGLAVMPAYSPFAIGWTVGLSMLLTGFCVLAPIPDAIVDSKPNFATGSSPIGTTATANFIDETDNGTDEAVRAAEELSLFEPSQPNVTQWMSRQNLPDGGESLEGSVRVPFAAGQRTASIHIPFTPPFAAAPEVECEVTGDIEARWKVSVAYPYGMRVELKRDLGTEPADIELAYCATCPLSQADAA